MREKVGSRYREVVPIYPHGWNQQQNEQCSYQNGMSHTVALETSQVPSPDDGWMDKQKEVVIIISKI